MYIMCLFKKKNKLHQPHHKISDTVEDDETARKWALCRTAPVGSCYLLKL